jgi:hypothetical protein
VGERRAGLGPDGALLSRFMWTKPREAFWQGSTGPEMTGFETGVATERSSGRVANGRLCVLPPSLEPTTYFSPFEDLMPSEEVAFPDRAVFRDQEDGSGPVPSNGVVVDSGKFDQW